MIGNINSVIVRLIKTEQKLVRVDSGPIGPLQVFMVLAGVVLKSINKKPL